MSLPVRGAWVEMSVPPSPYSRPWSLPVRGAWVEIMAASLICAEPMGRSPCGERGLKLPHNYCILRQLLGRSPCGERGLKSPTAFVALFTIPSLPVRGAWVEMLKESSQYILRSVAPRAGSVG